MNNNQENKHRSYTAIKQVFDDNAAIINTYGPLTVEVTIFNEKLAGIDQLSVSRGIDTSGVTNAKSLAKDHMAEVASEIASAGHAYAYGQQNHELMAIFNQSYSDIRYASDQSAAETALLIYQEASKLAGPLQDYLVTAEDSDELKQSIDQFKALTERQEGRLSLNPANTKQLSILFRDMDNLLSNRLDKLIYKIKRKQPVFYDTYGNARGIRDLGRRSSTSNAPEVPEDTTTANQ